MANSRALNRVIANKRLESFKMMPTSEGIYLSNAQLIELGEKLSNYLNNDGIHPDGICFMIGKIKKRLGKIEQTVEYIPYIVTNDTLEIFQNNDIIGQLSLTLASTLPNDQGENLLIDNQNRRMGIGQKTPPPKVK